MVHSVAYLKSKQHKPLHARRMDDAGDQALGLAVRKLRTERGWSQADLVLRVGMDRNDISLIELGRNSPSVCMLMRLRLRLALDARTANLRDDVEHRVQMQKPFEGGTTEKWM